MAKLSTVFAQVLLLACSINLSFSAGVGFAPYFDLTLKDGPLFTNVSNLSNQRTFTLAFALGGIRGCDPMWGAERDIDDPEIIEQLRAIQAQGGQFVVATGGALGPYLEHMCGTVDSLLEAYKKVLDVVQTPHLDIDVEAPINLDIMNGALAKLQQERPETTVSFTLMIQGEDYGLTPALGVDVLVSAKNHGVRVDLVNAMTMEFGGTSPTWGETVVGAAESVLRQMKEEIWPEKSEAELVKMLGVTPMIGRNFNGRVLETSDARYVVNWANTRGIGHLSFWSSARDNGGCPGSVSPYCSGAVQSQFEFTQIFQQFTGYLNK
jgi:chitinase